MRFHILACGQNCSVCRCESGLTNWAVAKQQSLTAVRSFLGIIRRMDSIVVRLTWNMKSRSQRQTQSRKSERHCHTRLSIMTLSFSSLKRLVHSRASRSSDDRKSGDDRNKGDDKSDDKNNSDGNL
jgi:hypothetical protein